MATVCTQSVRCSSAILLDLRTQVFWEMQPCRLLYVTISRSIVLPNAGWITSIWYCGEVLVVHRDRLENWFRALTWLQGPHLLSFNRTQFRVVIGLLTGHNTLRRRLYVMGLSNNPTCRKCGTEEETSVHILCECETLVSLRHAHLGSFFWTLRMLWI